MFVFVFSDAGSEDEVKVEESKPAAKSKKDRKKKKEQVCTFQLTFTVVVLFDILKLKRL